MERSHGEYSPIEPHENIHLGDLGTSQAPSRSRSPGKAATAYQGNTGYDPGAFLHGQTRGLHELPTRPTSDSRSESPNSLKDDIRDTPEAKLQTDFSTNKQLWKLLLKRCIRWLITVALCLGMIVALKLYGRLEVMDEMQHRIFSAIMTAFALALGLSLATAFKELMNDLRWRVLAHKPHSLPVVDLLFQSESVTNQIKLVLRPDASIVLRIGFALWVLLNIGAQVGVATISLTYDLTPTSSKFLWKPGNVTIPRLDIFQALDNPQHFRHGNNEALANSYGRAAELYKFGKAADMDHDTDSYYYSTTDPTTWTYRFRDHLPGPGHPDLFVVTNRTVNATGSCTSYPLKPLEANDTAKITWVENGIEQRIDMIQSGQGSYVYSVPQPEAMGRCGPRCTELFVMKYIDPSADDIQRMFYKCNVSMTPVANAYTPAHDIPDEIARKLTGSSGLSGFQNPSGGPKFPQVYESNRYIKGSFWASPFTEDRGGVASLLAEFAIGSLAVMSEANGVQNITDGHMPIQGDHLSVKTKKVTANLIVLVAGHLALFILVTLISNQVAVRDKSLFAMTKLIKPLLDMLDGMGSNAQGKTLAANTGISQAVYGVRRLPNGQKMVDLAPPDDQFPEEFWLPRDRYI